MPDKLDNVRAALREKKEFEKYKDLEREYSVNRYYLWNIINDDKYEPPASVCAKLGIAKYQPAPVCTNPDCSGYGEPHVYDCRTQTVKAKSKPRRKTQWRDLSKDELRWALDNRIAPRWLDTL